MARREQDIRKCEVEKKAKDAARPVPKSGYTNAYSNPTNKGTSGTQPQKSLNSGSIASNSRALPSREQKTTSYQNHIAEQRKAPGFSRADPYANKQTKQSSVTTSSKTSIPESNYRPDSRQYRDKNANAGGVNRGGYGNYEDESDRLARQMQQEYDRQADEDCLAQLQAKDYKKKASREQEDARIAHEIQEQIDRDMAQEVQNQGSSPENQQPHIRSGVRRRTGQDVLNYPNPTEHIQARDHPVFDNTTGYGGFGGAGRMPSRQGHDNTGYRQQNPYSGTPQYENRPSPSQYQQYPTNQELPDSQLEDDEMMQQAILDSMKASGRGRAR